MSENFIIANRTDVGRARSGNEDSMVTFDSPNGRVVVVCDGMGGMAAGDVASQLACDIITDILSNNTFATPTEAITKSMQAANQGILYRTQQNPELEGMGATCVMVIIKGGMVYYGWVGDSRIYYINDHNITMLTRDESSVSEAVDRGEMTSGEADYHPNKNEITNALGIANMRPPQLCTTPLKPDAGSVILLCSDGLTGMVDNNTICNVVSEDNVPLQQRANQLVDIANNNGGQDNITVQLIEFGVGAAPAMSPSVGAPKSAVRKAPARKESSSSSWMVWAAIVLGIIILGGGAWYIFSPTPQKDTPAVVSPTNNSGESNDEPTTTVTTNSSSSTHSSSTKTVTTTQTRQSPNKGNNNINGKTGPKKQKIEGQTGGKEGGSNGKTVSDNVKKSEPAPNTTSNPKPKTGERNNPTIYNGKE